MLVAGAGPSAVVSAHLSIPYTVAVVLLEGDLTLEDFTQAKVVDRQRQEVASRVAVEADGSLPYNDLAPARLTVVLRGGETLRGECGELGVGIESTLDTSVLERKRRACIAMSSHGRVADRLADAAASLATAEDERDFARAIIERLAS